jgi:adenine-specific DNA-methyltransferase
VPSLTDGHLLPAAERRRLDAMARLEPKARVALGQFLTPPPVATFLASLFDLDRADSGARLLDPGAGVGSLTAAFVARWKRERGGGLHVTAVEVDHALREPLAETLSDCETKGVDSEIVAEDFVAWSAERAGLGFAAVDAEPFDFVVMNPPYRKINTDSAERRLVSAFGVEVTNLYAVFLTLAVRLLREGGQLVAITPRSFANGPYFRSFRRDFLGLMSFRGLHVYDTRDTAFADADVLQENLILHAVKAPVGSPVRITSSSSANDDVVIIREVDHEVVVKPDDPEQFIHLMNDEVQASVADRMLHLPSSLSSTGLGVSTGRVVDFRTRPNLRMQPEPGTVPLVYPNHFHEGRVQWPLVKGKKANALAVNDLTRSLLLPNGAYVLVKRFTSKEERRRVVAVVAEPEQLPGEWVAFENHLNVFHRDHRPLDPAVARGLATFLNSTIVDLFFRQWSGHTQVNATDLRSLRYPDLSDLAALGSVVGDATLSQEKLDLLVTHHVAELNHRGEVDPVMAHQRVIEARDVLRQLGMPPAQQNERSALTLLALLDLTPDKGWADIEAPMRGITPMMEFMAAHYGKRYAPNSRETVRRQTVHQFVAAGIVVQNPDDPTRPTNSGRYVYQVPAELLEVLQVHATDEWPGALEQWHTVAPALRERWERARTMAMVPVTLPSGHEIVLSPGGQNPLIKAIIEEFCPRFVPGAHVLYIGDTGEKLAVYERTALAELGVEAEEHGKMPDVVVHDHDNGWLLLIEAVTSHGPVDPKRHEELGALFGKSAAGVVYVTAFMDRKTLGERLGQIAWETEVWVAEAPTHMIHFDGERFLGPYSG